MSERLKTGELERIPLFPLPNAVLLPQTIIRLHIFEPRYRKMTKDLLESGGALAIGKTIPGEYDDAGRPRVRPIVGIGRISRHLRLPDGRYYLIVRGICRARIREELETTEPYRVVRATRMREPYPGRGDTELIDKMMLLGYAKQLVQLDPNLSPLFLQHLVRVEHVSGMCDLLAAHLFEFPEELQEVLETPRVDKRVEMLIANVTSRFEGAVGPDVEFYN